MKKCLVIFVLLVAAVMVCVGCAEEKSEESITYRDVSELTSAPESVTSSENADMTAEVTEQPETSGQTETEISVDDLALPEAVDISKCTIIPEDFSDHSAQLEKLGYTEGTEEYDLYDLLLDISCETSMYSGRMDNQILASWLYFTVDYYWKYKNEVLLIAKNLLSMYDIGIPDQSIFPLQGEVPDPSEVGLLEQYRVMKAVWIENNTYRKNALIKLRECFSSEILKDFEYRDSMLTVLSAAIERIKYAEPYAEDPFHDDVLEISKEWDEALQMLRVTVKTTCSFYKNQKTDEITPITGVSSATIEECYKDENGLSVLKLLFTPQEAYEVSNVNYYNYAFGIILQNKVYNTQLGIYAVYYFNPNFPYFLYPDVDWDETVTVENEHLHKALTKFFYDIKGTEGYTRRDLSFIEKLEILRATCKDENGDPTGPKFSRIYMYLDTRVCKIYYPEYYKTADRGPRGAVLPPASQYYTVEGEWIEDIPQSDMDLFIALKYLQSADET